MKELSDLECPVQHSRINVSSHFFVGQGAEAGCFVKRAVIRRQCDFRTVGRGSEPIVSAKNCTQGTLIDGDVVTHNVLAMFVVVKRIVDERDVADDVIAIRVFREIGQVGVAIDVRRFRRVDSRVKMLLTIWRKWMHNTT